MKFNNLQLYNRLTRSATRSAGGLNKSDMRRINEVYGPGTYQFGGAMDEFTIFTLNIAMFEKANKAKLSQKIKSINADIVFIQEDIVKTSSNDYEWLNNGKEPRYQLLYQCVSHPIASGLGNRLANSIYKKNSIKGEFDLSQRYSYNAVDDITVAEKAAKRCAALSKFRNILMASVHLSGGRFDDKEFKKLGELKEKQLSKLVELGVDIIAGDFNGDISIDKLTSKGKDAFDKYWTAGHGMLKGKGYSRVDLDGSTSARVDHIYYKDSKLKLLDAKIIDCLDVSDHNGLLAKFAITDHSESCNSIFSYDCIIYPDNFSEVILKQGSIIYRSSKGPCNEDHMFFGGIKTATMYADAHNTIKGYIVKRDLRLLDLNNPTNIKKLSDEAKNADNITKMAVQLYFGIGIREMSRNSYHTKTGHMKDVEILGCDVVPGYTYQICSSGFITAKNRIDEYYISRLVLKFVCSLGFDGTIHIGMLPRAHMGASGPPAFHDEIGICSCLDSLKLMP